MVRSCCICRNLYGVEGVTFHSIPTRQNLKVKWINAIGKKVSKYAFVCSKHFKANDIMFTSIIKGSIQRRLHSEAVPTLYLIHEKEIEHGKTNIDFVEQVCEDKENQYQNVSYPNYTNKLQEIENIAENVNAAKRKERNVENNKERCHVTRYVGDFRRQDFTCDRNWEIFRKYYEQTSKKVKNFQDIIKHRNKKIKKLEDLMDHLKKKGLISSEAAVTIEVS